MYLIFSANKSGEYFGYARMASPILDDGSRVMGAAPKPETIIDASDVPKSTRGVLEVAYGREWLLTPDTPGGA